MGVTAVRSAGVRWAAGGAGVLVLAADQLSKAVILRARPASSGGVIAVRLVRTSSRGVALFLAVALGGALGNLADRVFRSPGLGRGAVIDWIHVWGYPATFNLADVAIRAGAVGAVAVLVVTWAGPEGWVLARRGAS